MNDYTAMNQEELSEVQRELQKRYDDFKAKNLALDITRGRPCPEQLDLSIKMLDSVNSVNLNDHNALYRNYGELAGLPIAREFFAKHLNVKPEEVIVGGNSSLRMMYDMVERAMYKGVESGMPPWKEYPKVKFLCPVPGYDRHFAITEFHGIEMINVPLLETGPDMDMVERLVKSDAAIKGIWCVPKYSNPTGTIYSNDTVRRLAWMPAAAKDFRIFWDNAYMVHTLEDEEHYLEDILAECKKADNDDRVYIFTSTSKITFAGAGVAMMASSAANVRHMLTQIGYQTIGPDKINQLRHVRFLQNEISIADLMQQHAQILRPKFEAVYEILEREFGGSRMVSWTKPRGGYFISFDTPEGCAAETVRLAKEAGAKFTPAGNTFPYGKDPKDSNIRIAPSLPNTPEIAAATELLAICTKLAYVNKLLAAQ